MRRCINLGMFGFEQPKPRFEIRRSSDNQYYFVLLAPNGEVIATSEMYTSKQGCKSGIESVKRNAPKADIIDIT